MEWRKISGSAGADVVTLRYGAELPKTHYRVQRTLTMRSMLPWVRVEESVENLLLVDRPVQWMQHATFGPPFVEPGKSLLRISATRGHRNGELPAGESPRERLMPADTPGGSYTALLMDSSRDYQFFTLTHREYPVTIGYLFAASGNPWAADWQENRRARQKPWEGKVVARGIEFGTSPYAEGLRRAVDRGTLFNTPTFRWIGARQTLRTEFIIFLSEKRVRDARWVNQEVVIDEESGNAGRGCCARGTRHPKSAFMFCFLTVVPANTASLLRKCTVGRRFRRTRETRRSVQRIRLTTSATAEVNRLNNSSAPSDSILKILRTTNAGVWEMLVDRPQQGHKWMPGSAAWRDKAIAAAVSELRNLPQGIRIKDLPANICPDTGRT